MTVALAIAVVLLAAGLLYAVLVRPHEAESERVDLDGSNRTTIVPPGGTYTPKQLHLDGVGRKLYWGDREGMRVMRCDLDGSNVETLVQTGVGEDGRHDETISAAGHRIGTEQHPAPSRLEQRLDEHGDRRIAARRGDTPYTAANIY